jgi:phage terminase small subunit
MLRGRKPKPDHLRVVAGTDRPCVRRGEGPKFEAAAGALPPPAFMKSKDARAEWNRLVPMLQANKLLTDADMTALVHLCQLHGAIVALYRKDCEPTAAQLSQLRIYLAEFGLTPASRTRVGGTGSGEKKNRFTGHGKPT